MDQGKRRLLKALPFAAMAPALMFKIGSQDVESYELKPDKKYVFRLPKEADLTQKELTILRERFSARGINATVVQGDIEIYEL